MTFSIYHMKYELYNELDTNYTLYIYYYRLLQKVGFFK